MKLRGGGTEQLSSLQTSAIISGSSLTGISSGITPAAASVFGISTYSADDGISAQSVISNSIDFSANQTQTIEINGRTYTVKNLQSVASSFSYTLDEDTGVITFLNDKFEITGQSDVSHNVVLNGANCTFYGGSLSDTIVANGFNSRIYGGDGDDSIVVNNLESIIYGEAGADTITVDVDSIRVKVYGGEGDNIYNIKGISNTVYGGSGNEAFNIGTAASGAFVDGGEGTNILNDSGTNTSAANVVNSSGEDISNIFGGEIAAGATKTIVLDGKEYTITNNNSTASSIYAKVSNGVVDFVQGEYFTIKAQSDVSHNVRLSSKYLTYYGGDLDDSVVVLVAHCVVYGGKGNDTLTTNADNGATKLFGEDGDDTIYVNGNSPYGASLFDGGNGDDNIHINVNVAGGIYGGSGNDTFYVNTNYNKIDCGDGDDRVVFNSESRKGNIIAGGSGTNTINSTTGVNYTTDFAGSQASRVDFAAGETKTVKINGINYTVKNTLSSANSLVYYYNAVSGEIVLGGSYLNITGQSDKEHNIQFYGMNSTLTTGSKNDKITTYSSQCTVSAGAGDDEIITQNIGSLFQYLHGQDGNDKITVNGSYTYVYGENGDDELILNFYDAVKCDKDGGSGNDTYRLNASGITITDSQGDNIFYVESDNNNISAGSGADTFYVNGNTNTLKGAGGNDYFVVNGENNTIDGGTGTNLYVDNSSGTTTLYNVTTDPNSGEINFVAVNQKVTLTFDDKTYIFENACAEGTSPASNTVKYSYNPTTGEVSLTGSNFTVTGQDNKEHTFRINGENNVINGANGNDTVIIDFGSNNIVNAGAGADTITLNSADNAVYGGSGNDTINLNASSTKEISGGDGDDVININSSNNTNIKTGLGNDSVTGTGSSNTIDFESGNNSAVLNGNGNTMIAGDGNNKLSAIGNNNSITAGSGKNTIGVDGQNNTILADGDLTANIYGSGNHLTSTDRADITINGDNNETDSKSGTINISGNNNTSNTGGNNDILITGDSNTLHSVAGNNNVDIYGSQNEFVSESGNNTLNINGDNNTASSASGTNNVTITGNTNSYQGGSDVDKITVSGDENKAFGGGANDVFVVTSGNLNEIDGEDGNNNRLIDDGIDTIYRNVKLVRYAPLNLRLQVGANSDDFITLQFECNLTDIDLDFSTPESSVENIQKIDDMLNSIYQQTAGIGAMLNRLESIQDSQTTTIENYTSARSTIMDADIAEESANYVRNQILQQTTTSLLAQASALNSSLALSLINTL